MIVQSGNLTTYTKRVALCFVLACEMWTGASSAGPSRAKPTLCPSAAITVFSCQTTKQEIISICLSPGSQFTILSRQKAGLLRSEKVTSAEEAIIGASAHGSSVVLQLESASRTTKLFVDGVPDDMTPAIFEIADGPASKHVCVLDSQFEEPGIITRNGVTKVAMMITLVQAGLATRLANPPRWPETR